MNPSEGRLTRRLPLGAFVVTFTAGADAFAQTAVAPRPHQPASVPTQSATPGGSPTWLQAAEVAVVAALVGVLIGYVLGRRSAR